MKTTGIDTRDSDILFKKYAGVLDRPECLSLLGFSGLLTIRLYKKTTNSFLSLHRAVKKYSKTIAMHLSEILPIKKTGLFHIIEQEYRKFTHCVNKKIILGRMAMAFRTI